jgi:NACalpha-BTF3-like transcription factor
MVEAQEQAKQLDSVTDNVDEKEVDASKAHEALSALSSAKTQKTSPAEHLCVVSKEDVDLIVSELEVTEEVAVKALREAAAAASSHVGEPLVVTALRKVVW